MKVLLFLCVCIAVASARRSYLPDYYDASSPDHSLTDEYAVIFHEHHRDNVDVHELGARHGMKWLHQLEHHESVHIFHHANKSDILPQLHESPEVQWVERQVLRRRYRRTNDPLYSSSWTLQGRAGVDINVEGAWALGYDGTGVTVCIVDDGVFHAHDEFVGRFNTIASRDVNFGDDDVDPYHWDVHGTASAGVAAAAANNNKCSVGVAPGATVSGVRILARDTTDADEAVGVTYRQDLNHIYSNSWGPNDNGATLEGPGRLLLSAMENAVEAGRDGKGSVFVWACGNGREVGDTCNYDGYANSRFTIAIGAYEWNGEQAYYSESCAALVACTGSSDRHNHQVNTCSPNNECYTHFGGTSASSPMAAGVAALILNARPELTWRDVQNVFIRSSQRIDPNDDEWVQNGAGLWVNMKYGYGRVDAEAAVILAASIPLLPAEYEKTAVGGSSGAIPDKGEGSFEDTVVVTEDLIVEHVEVKVQVQHRHRGHLYIQIESPAGTVSPLALAHNDMSANYFWTFTSMRHWGEHSAGEWRLTVTDMVTGTSGRMSSGWNLRVYGHRG